jgi:hypothetical protein
MNARTSATLSRRRKPCRRPNYSVERYSEPSIPRTRLDKEVNRLKAVTSMARLLITAERRRQV